MEQNIRGLLAYLFGWIGGLVVLLAGKETNSDETKFNACQSIVLSVISWLSSIIFNSLPIPFIGIVGLVITIFIGVLEIIGAVKAYKEQQYELPVISDLTRKIFKGALEN